MQRVKGLDGGFLSLESPTAHLHILGILVFDPGEEGTNFEDVKDLVFSRLPLVPPFRQRMIEVPFGLQHPSLVDDPEFDIEFHVRRASVPAPGGLGELAALAADVASRPLDRRRPLWEFHVVEGVEGGRIALIPKVHHSIIDGVSGVEVMAAFFDLSPQPVPRPLFGPSRRRSRPGWSGPATTRAATTAATATRASSGTATTTGPPIRTGRPIRSREEWTGGATWWPRFPERPTRWCAR